MSSKHNGKNMAADTRIRQWILALRQTDKIATRKSVMHVDDKIQYKLQTKDMLAIVRITKVPPVP